MFRSFLFTTVSPTPSPLLHFHHRTAHPLCLSQVKWIIYNTFVLCLHCEVWGDFSREQQGENILEKMGREERWEKNVWLSNADGYFFFISKWRKILKAQLMFEEKSKKEREENIFSEKVKGYSKIEGERDRNCRGCQAVICTLPNPTCQSNQFFSFLLYPIFSIGFFSSFSTN
jgi:hypothetical protein